MQQPVPNATPKLTKCAQLKAMLKSPELEFIMEAHNGLSAKIAEEAGFRGIWASGLSMSAALGVRDSNEASWTQVLEMLEFMADATSVPILVDGDTGYGNFNNMRRLVAKLCQRNIAGVCIEDKLFPKTNSFIGELQPLADMDEFCGKIKAGKDSQLDDDFSVVARIEALIAGRGMAEALRRAEAYHAAGADGLLIHSKLSNPDEIVNFAREWGNRCPVVIVPTMYYAAPTDLFRKSGISLVIWANHNLRTAISAMRETSRRIFADQSLLGVEDRIAPVSDVFAIQGDLELRQAEKRYLPATAAPKAVVLAASRGAALGELTAERPKAMLDIRGRPLLHRLVDSLRESGIGDVTVVRGFGKETIKLSGVKFADNDSYADTGEVASVSCAKDALKGPAVIVYGDILFRRFVLDGLMQDERDICIVVDGRNRDHASARASDLVRCSRPYSDDFLSGEEPVDLVSFGALAGEAHGESIGMIRTTAIGAAIVAREIAAMEAEGVAKKASVPDLLSRLLAKGQKIGVHYTAGHWLDVDDVADLARARNFT
jgi:phosphoenolpyruvate phosphomutase